MNLVCHNEHMVAVAKLSQFLKLFFCPDSADRIVGTAQQKQLYILGCDLFFQIVEVNFIMSVRQKKRAFYDLSIVIANHLKERVINRRLNQYTVALFCQSAYRHRKGEYHTGGFYKPFRLWLPVKPTVKPAIQRVKIFSFYLAITENPMGNRILQCIQHRLRRLKIHIRHPQWQHIYVTSAFHGEIIFQAVCLFPVNFPVKIIGCHF